MRRRGKFRAGLRIFPGCHARVSGSNFFVESSARQSGRVVQGGGFKSHYHRMRGFEPHSCRMTGDDARAAVADGCARSPEG